MQTYIALTSKSSVVCIYTVLSQINQKFVANGFVPRFERFHQIHVSWLNLVFLISSVIDPAIVERGEAWVRGYGAATRSMAKPLWEFQGLGVTWDTFMNYSTCIWHIIRLIKTPKLTWHAFLVVQLIIFN